jgi:hypothetical protein
MTWELQSETQLSGTTKLPGDGTHLAPTVRQRAAWSGPSHISWGDGQPVNRKNSEKNPPQSHPMHDESRFESPGTEPRSPRSEMSCVWHCWATDAGNCSDRCVRLLLDLLAT